MSGNSASLVQCTPPSFLASLLSADINKIDNVQNISELFEHTGAAGFSVTQKSEDAAQDKKGKRFNSFEQWPNQRKVKITPVDFRASLSSIIAALKANVDANAATEKKQISNRLSSQGMLTGLSIESLLFALQEFLIGERVLMHFSSQNALENMDISREKISEQRISEYEQQSKLVEKANQESRGAEIIATVGLALVSLSFGVATFITAGAILPLVALGAAFLVAGGVVGLVKAGFQYLQMQEMVNGDPQKAREYGKIIKTLGYVEMACMVASFAVDAFLLVSWVLRNAGNITLGLGNAVRKAVGPNMQVHELGYIGKVGEEASKALQTTEEIAIGMDTAKALRIHELSAPEFATSLREVLKKIGFKADLKKIETIIETAHQETRMLQAETSIMKAANTAKLEYSKAFAGRLSSVIRKEWASSALEGVGNSLRIKLQVAKDWSLLFRIIMLTIMSAATGRLEYKAAESKNLANKAAAKLKVERDVMQPLVQKAITDKLEDLEKNAEEMAKVLKYIAEWVTQFIEAKKSAIHAMRPAA